MFHKSLSRRIAAAILAATLTLGGAVGIGMASVDKNPESAPIEHAGGTWSFTGPDGGKGWSGTQGATWS